MSLLIDKKPSKLPDNNITWVEKVDKTEFISNKKFRFEYLFTKEILFEVFMQSKEHAFSGVFVLNNLLMLRGKFGDPDTIASGRLSNSLEKDSGGIEDVKQNSDQLHCQMSVVEDKPKNALRLTFSMIGSFDILYPIMISIYEVIGQNRKFIYQTQITQKSVKDGRELFLFSPVVINTDVFENDIISTKKIEFEVIRFKQEKTKEISQKSIGKRRLRLKNILELKEGKAFNIDILNNLGKQVGQV